MTWFLGIDGGGTHTRALIVDATGRVLGYGKGGGSNYHSVGLASALGAVEEAVAEARAQARVAGSAEAAFLGLAGVRTEADHRVWRQALAALAVPLARVPEQIGLDHDLRIGLAAGCGSGPGLIVIAGTGSAAYGRDEQGHTAQSGGWGWPVDDQGGGAWLALRAVRAVAEATDGRGSGTALEPALFAEVGVGTARDLVQWVSRSETTKAVLASLAPVVLEAAADDQIAGNLLEEGAHHLAAMLRAVAIRLNLQEHPLSIVPAGGLLGHSGYRRALVSRLRSVLPLGTVLEQPCAAVAGAVALAAELAQRPFAPDVRSRWTHEISGLSGG